MLKDTLEKFGYPQSLVKEYQNWLLLCRPKQLTLGSLILICKEQVAAFSEISETSADELRPIIKDIENRLKAALKYDKINYLMVMMVDPEVHFHIIPRYSTDKDFQGIIFKDFEWPRVPDFGGAVNEISEAQFEDLTLFLRDVFLTETEFGSKI